MMPQTGEVEVVVQLQKRQRPVLRRAPADSVCSHFVCLVRGRVNKERSVGHGIRLKPLQSFDRSSLVLASCNSKLDETTLKRLLCFVHHPVVGDRGADRATAKFFEAQRGLERAFVVPVQNTHEWEKEIPAPLALVLQAIKLEEN
jgi:hypothetical protein